MRLASTIRAVSILKGLLALRSGRSMSSLGLLVCLVLLCVGCKKKAEAQEATRVSMMAEAIKFEYAVYLLPGNMKDPEAAFRKAVTKNFPKLNIVEDVGKASKEAVVSGHFQRDVPRRYTPPSLEMLRYAGHGLTPEQEHKLQKANVAFVLQFGHPSAQVWTGLRNADLLVEEVARESDGMVWDEETREVFTPEAWHERKLAKWPGGIPNISSETVVHIYQNGDFMREITLGMDKAGLPDVVIENSPWSDENQVANVINSFCQAMAEGQLLTVPGKAEMHLQDIRNEAARTSAMGDLGENAAGVAHLYLKNGQKQEGDADNRLIEITAERYMGPDIHAKQERMIGCTFGSQPDNLTHVEHPDELLEASRKARLKLPELRAGFNKGLAPGEYIDLKAPFKTSEGGNEWMWVEVTEWKGQKIKGLLQNDPQAVEGLAVGQAVEVKEEEVFDYIHVFADKHREGNTTGEILGQMEDQEEKKAHPFRVGGIAFTAKPETPECEPH